MEPSHRLVPNANGNGKVASLASTSNSLGLHDTMQYGPRTLATEIHTVDSGLKERLENWEETQNSLKLTMQRNVYGMHAPMRLLMERKLVSHSPHIPAFAKANGYSNVHLDVLMGRDELIEAHDVFGGFATGGVSRLEGEFRVEMERKLKI